MQVAIIGAGPSLHADDVALIQRAGIFTIAVNTAWKHARFCDVIFAADAVWWQHYGKEVDIPAERWCCWQSSTSGAEFFEGGMSGWNSGANAILFAIQKKPSTILMTGFDCSLRHGSHVHGDHPRTPNPDADAVRRWHTQFARVATIAKKAAVPLLNCSRYTELASIQRAQLHEVIHGAGRDFRVQL
jgi:hypothetical protein